MVYVSVCDDNEMTAQKLKLLICKEFSGKNIACDCRVYLSGDEFLSVNEEKENELIILDIEMPGMSGIQVAERLKDTGRNKSIVFLTDYGQLVFQSLKCYPFAFIRKKHMETEIPEMLEQFLARMEKKKAAFIFSVGRNTIKMPAEEIMHLIYREHKVVLVNKDHETYAFRGTIRECWEQLKGGCFFQVNSGAIVNLRFGKRLEDAWIVMEDGSKIPVSREKRRACRLEFMKCWRENA